MGRQRLVLRILCWFSCCAVVVQGDWGDYADTSFQCPAITTCDPICVSHVDECPPELRCNATETLCPNGRACVKNIATDCPPPSRAEESPNPCRETNPCNKTVTCLRTNLYLEDCVRLYEDFYSNATNCTRVREMQHGEWISWASPGHVFCYVWICMVTTALLSWCAYNQRMRPVGQSVPLHDFTYATGRRRSSYTSLEGSTDGVKWTQTGYKATWLGDTIYVLVLATLAGFHILLAILTAFYYAQQEGHGLFINPPVYKSDVQVLMAFEITWLVAFLWTLSLKWPSSVRALFLRRCHLYEATHVAVFAPTSHTVPRNKDVSAQAPYIALIKKATIFFFKQLDNFYAFIFSEVNRPNIPGKFHFKKVDKDKSFTFHLRRYNYDEVTETFMPGIILMGHSIEELMDHKGGLTEKEVEARQKVVGKNVIPMKKPSLVALALAEGSKIFYTYQIYIIWWWFNFWYWMMGMVYFSMFVLGGVTTVYVTYLNELKLFKLGEVSGVVKAIRNGEWVLVPQKDLVPGDVIVVEAGQAHCDMVLLQANTVLVDESSITGEATPVAKTGVDMAGGSALYSTREHKKNTISAGTTILESDEKGAEAIGLVTHTGSFTTKGNLLRDILFYERHKFKFDHEIVLVFAILILYAMFGFFLTVYFLSEDQVVYAVFYGMYVVETAIPPLIPTVFIVSVGISADRLRRMRIATSDNREILVTGKVKMAFFDKTGTLTNQGLDFISSHCFADGKATNSAETRKLMGRGMATCHTLAKTDQGVFIGTFIDEVMFKSTSAAMSSSGGPMVIETPDGGKMKILKRFEFDHSSMSQSVLVEDETGKVFSFVKGSAESIKKVCRGETLPSNFTELSENASKQGIYQIALATALAPPGEVLESGETSYAFVPREEVERDLTFVGFMDFKNTLRAETPGTLKSLKEGNVSTVMVTGDSVFTGIHIARESGLIDSDATVILGRSVNPKGGAIFWVDGTTNEPTSLPSRLALANRDNNLTLAVTGEVWQGLLSKWPEQAAELAPFISIYGRCTPDNKVSVVAHFVKRGMITMMCGDGGNDCGALRTAHVGVALSDSEASIVSPFTSLDKSIESAVEVLREGRCCLASAFSSYKFMILYGQLETILQITSAYFAVGYAEWNWVWLDGVIVVPLAFLLPLSKAAKTLGPLRPTSSLLGPQTVSSVCGILAIDVTCLTTALMVLHHQEWYECRKWTSLDMSSVIGLGDNYESSVTFIMTVSQFVFSAMANNFGFTFRENFFRNYPFVACATFFTLVHFFIVLVPGPVSCVFRMNCLNDYNFVGSVYEMGPVPLQNSYNMTLMPEDFRIFLAVLLASNMVLVLSWEYFIVGSRWGKHLCLGLGTVVHGKEDPMSLENLKSLEMIETAETDGSPKYERISSRGLHDKSEASCNPDFSTSKWDLTERKEEDP